MISTIYNDIMKSVKLELSMNAYFDGWDYVDETKFENDDIKINVKSRSRSMSMKAIKSQPVSPSFFDTPEPPKQSLLTEKVVVEKLRIAGKDDQKVADLKMNIKVRSWLSYCRKGC